jgi:hypothetical protein
MIQTSRKLSSAAVSFAMIVPLLLHFAPYQLQSVMNVFQSSICGCNFMQSRRYFIFFEFGPAPKMRRPAGASPDANKRATIFACDANERPRTLWMSKMHRALLEMPSRRFEGCRLATATLKSGHTTTQPHGKHCADRS